MIFLLKSPTSNSSRTVYCLTDNACYLINLINEEYIREVNAAISERRSPLKTKKVDIILRIAVSLHIFNSVPDNLLQQIETQMPEQEISKGTDEKAIIYLTWAESQKEIFVEVSLNLYSLIFFTPINYFLFHVTLTWLFFLPLIFFQRIIIH